MSLQSENINELAAALAKAQGEMSGASKSAVNPFYNSKYADLNSVWSACRESLSRNGLAVIQTTNHMNGQLMLVTTLGHASGQWIRSELPVKYSEETTEINKYGKEIKVNPLQKMGSCLTYLRRYGLSAIVGVAPDEDDDGNSANGSGEKKEEIRPISPAQANELDNLLSECGDSYKKHVLAFIKKPPISAQSLFHLPISEYDRMKSAALKKIEEMKESSKVTQLVGAGNDR